MDKMEIDYDIDDNIDIEINQNNININNIGNKENVKYVFVCLCVLFEKTN